jgi:hypothetical protein
MPISNYPYGFLAGINVRGMPILNTYSGNVYWVHSGTGSNGNNGQFNQPMATINGALSIATASNGDIILVKPGHAETIADATTVNLNKAGVAIIGLGVGSLRPILTFSAVASNIPVTAANVTVQNMICYGTRATAFTTSAFTTTGTALSPDLLLDTIEFRDSSATTGFLAGYTTNSTANSWDGFTMTNCKFYGLGTLTRTAVVSTVACDRLTLTDNFGQSLQTTVAMLMTTAATNNTNCNIARNKFQGAHTSSTLACGISGTGTAWSGIAENNYFFSLASGTGIWIPTTTKLALFQNYAPIAGAYATQGTLNPLAT